jgi:hypothetical protein
MWSLPKTQRNDERITEIAFGAGMAVPCDARHATATHVTTWTAMTDIQLMSAYQYSNEAKVR